MNSFFQKIKSIFISEEKRFNSTLLEELEIKNFINIRKLDSQLSLEKRYVCIRKLQNSGKISGVFLSDKSFFFSISNEELSEIRNSLKKQGQVELSPLKDRWSINEKTLIPFLMHLENGLIGNDKFYSFTFLQREFINVLKNVEEYNLEELQKTYGFELEDILNLVGKIVDEKELDGVVQKKYLYTGFKQFEEIVSEFIEDNFEDSLEMTFDFISDKLEISEKDAERFLVNYVENNPHKLIVYPLEKKIKFKG